MSEENKFFGKKIIYWVPKPDVLERILDVLLLLRKLGEVITHDLLQIHYFQAPEDFFLLLLLRKLGEVITHDLLQIHYFQAPEDCFLTPLIVVILDQGLIAVCQDFSKFLLSSGATRKEGSQIIGNLLDKSEEIKFKVQLAKKDLKLLGIFWISQKRSSYWGKSYVLGTPKYLHKIYSKMSNSYYQLL
ncbi:hypothetical protein QE152_g5993 [Popillia japonica]|uniref:Uncharacterized protein n=1 Tax=Popillia japonica TaxID=7064 RepID=A0AAW1MKX0_POPJA